MSISISHARAKRKYRTKVEDLAQNFTHTAKIGGKRRAKSQTLGQGGVVWCFPITQKEGGGVRFR